jgi:hypothetical protein
VTIFKEMHEAREIGSQRGYHELLRMLSEAIALGYVEQVPVMKPHPYAPRRTWYREKETGLIYSLDPPDERGGWWAEVDPSDVIAPGDRNKRKVLAMRSTQMFSEWKPWVGIGLFSFVFFLVAFGLAKIFAAHGSWWDTSWLDVLWGAARVALFVTFLTVLGLGAKR